MKQIIESKSLEKLLEGSDEQKLHKFDQILSESKIKRIATFDKYVIGLKESGEIVRVVIVEGKILSTAIMPIQLAEEKAGPTAVRSMVEWCIGGALPDEDQFAEFLNQISTKEAKLSIAEKKLDKFLAAMPKPKEEWVKTFGDKVESLQSIGQALDHLSAIAQVAERVSVTQSMGKAICEHAAVFAQPLGTVVSTLRDVLGSGDQVGANKFMEQFGSHWQNLCITGQFLKNVGEVK